MLLEFRMSNYKSFKDETIFSLVPAPKQKGLDYSILHATVGRKTYKGLCSAVIYGPNAAGKTKHHWGNGFLQNNRASRKYPK